MYNFCKPAPQKCENFSRPWAWFSTLLPLQHKTSPLPTITDPVTWVRISQICIFGLDRKFSCSLAMLDGTHQANRYYNATAQVDFIPYGGLAASIPSKCPPAFSNQTASGNYSARLAITEPSSYDSVDDLANVFLTLWPLDYNFTKLLSGQRITDMPGLDFALFSSEWVRPTLNPRSLLDV